MADYSIRHKVSSEYRISAWSGGMTTEIGISPEKSRYADRDFLWRVSSATVDLEESVFTALPDYNRIIMTLEGDLDLCHGNGRWIHLREFEPHAFDGGEETVSRGKVVDFNLMLRKGCVDGTLVPITFCEDGACSAGEEVLRDIEKYNEIMIYCYRGSVTVKVQDETETVLKNGESLWINGNSSGLQLNLCADSGARAVMAAVCGAKESLINF